MHCHLFDIQPSCLILLGLYRQNCMSDCYTQKTSLFKSFSLSCDPFTLRSFRMICVIHFSILALLRCTSHRRMAVLSSAVAASASSFSLSLMSSTFRSFSPGSCSCLPAVRRNKYCSTSCEASGSQHQVSGENSASLTKLTYLYTQGSQA